MKIKKHRIHITRKTFNMLVVAVAVAVIITVVAMIAGNSATVNITGSTLAYYIDDEQYVFGTEPYICDNTVYLPAEDILSVYGYTCEMDEESGVMSIYNEDGVTYMYKDKNVLSTEKDTYTFNLAAMRRGGVMYMPAEMFADCCDDELVVGGSFKVVERPYWDLMQNT